MTTSIPTTGSPLEWQSFGFLQTAIDALDDPILIKDVQHRWIGCNTAFCRLLNLPREAIIGHSDDEYLPKEIYEVFWQVDDLVISSAQPHANEEIITDGQGMTRTLWTRKYPLKDAQDMVVGLIGVITDITAIKRRQEEIERLAAELGEKAEIIEIQTTLLDQLAVPVIQVWKGVLLLPLIGIIDSRRSVQVMENMLESIARIRAQVVILDITGVPIVDTSVAGYLIRAVQSAQLLGCESILVGISPEIAQTLVQLGVDFGQIKTRATLQNGLEYALKRHSQN